MSLLATPSTAIVSSESKNALVRENGENRM